MSVTVNPVEAQAPVVVATRRRKGKNFVVVVSADDGWYKQVGGQRSRFCTAAVVTKWTVGSLPMVELRSDPDQAAAMPARYTGRGRYSAIWSVSVPIEGEPAQ